MKKYACLILFALLLNGCDDGDLTVDEIAFDDITSTSCDPTTNTLIYKLKEQESLLLQLGANSLINDPTVKDTVEYPIDNESNFRVVYRAYDGKVATGNICGVIPPKTPNVTTEWLGTDGIIKIVTKQITSAPDKTDGSTRITGYNHNIVFENITFLKPNGPQTQEEYVFGDYTVNVPALPLTFVQGDAGQCPVQKQVYNFNTKASLMIENIDPSLLVNVATTADNPRKGVVGSTTNKLNYRTFDGTLTKAYFCNSPVPTNPPVKELWIGQDGGNIEVSTEITGNIVIHTIVLKNVTLKKGNSSFLLGNNFLLGQIKYSLNP